MKKQELNDVLSNNTYPGRGICLGVDESGEYAVIVSGWPPDVHWLLYHGPQRQQPQPHF